VDEINLFFETNPVDVIILDGRPLFDPYNIGACLGIAPQTIRKHMGNMSDKQVVTITNMTSADVNVTGIRKFNNRGEKFLTEPGVYKFIIKSRSENAEKFLDWIVEEVLPSIKRLTFFSSILRPNMNI